MTLLVDTSALVALVNGDDRFHDRAQQSWGELLDEGRVLRTNSYVLTETAALLQSRLGMSAARMLHTDFTPALSVRFVDRPLHDLAVTALLAANRRSVSFVDWTSFEQMREEHLDEAFAFEGDFEAQGFTLAP